jgi:hypothetical protein
MAEMMIHLAVLASHVQPQALGQPVVEPEAEVNLRPRAPLYLHFKAAGAEYA